MRETLVTDAPLEIERVIAYGGTMARRTNYGFEKKQRELKKQKKNQEKLARRNRDEEPSPESGEAAVTDEAQPESGKPDSD